MTVHLSNSEIEISEKGIQLLLMNHLLVIENNDQRQPKFKRNQKVKE